MLRQILQISRTVILKELTERHSTTCRKRILYVFDHIARKNLESLEKLIVTVMDIMEGERENGQTKLKI